MTIKIAIPLDNGHLAQHFGHCDQFALVESHPESGSIDRMALALPPAHEPGALPKWLQNQGVQAVIVGSLGQRAQQLFRHFGIQVQCGVPGDTVENLVAAFHARRLAADIPPCDHQGCHH